MVPTVEGTRCAAVEVLLGSSTVKELIRRGDLHAIKEVMEKSENMGMRTFDGALFHLYKEGTVTLDEALKNADSPNNLRLRINLSEKGGNVAAASGLSLSLEATEEEQAIEA